MFKSDFCCSWWSCQDSVRFASTVRPVRIKNQILAAVISESGERWPCMRWTYSLGQRSAWCKKSYSAHKPQLPAWLFTWYHQTSTCSLAAFPPPAGTALGQQESPLKLHANRCMGNNPVGIPEAHAYIHAHHREWFHLLHLQTSSIYQV